MAMITCVCCSVFLLLALSEAGTRMTAMDYIVKANDNVFYTADGEKLYFTDIKMPQRVYSDRTLENFSDNLEQDAAIKLKDRLWPGAVIPYTVAPSLAQSDSGVQTVKEAMAEWESKTCIRFVERTNEVDYVEFAIHLGCNADVGRKLGKQTISLGDGCLHRSVVIHEIGHIVGFWHEQNRPDRDEYVQILTDNIRDQYKEAFAMFSKYRIDSRGVEYDYNSIMHYGTKAFSKNGLPTILPKKAGVFSLGNDQLSPLDIKQANLLYNCDEINRGWTVWSQWTECDKPCNAGRQERTRVCTSLVNGRQLCPGYRLEERVCNADACPDWPRFPEDFSFDQMRIDGDRKSECILIYERSDYQEWNSYSFCNRGKRIIKMRWSDFGPLTGMKCTQIIEPREGINNRWYDNFLCVPKEAPYNFTWSFQGPPAGAACIQWYAKEGRDGWDDNFLCLEGKRIPLEAVDGEWGDWTQWSRCTKSCGGGKMRRLRLCNQPEPKHGGRACSGAFFEDVSCNEHDCPSLPKCGGVLHGAKGEFHSPNYPANYPSMTNCTWFIAGTPGKRIVLIIQSFDLEKLFEEPCKFDYVEIRDGGAANKTLGRFCGDNLPEPISSSGSSLWIRMVTDSNDNKAGFRASWETIDEEPQGCGGVQSGIVGKIFSPNFPLNYPPEKTCVWTVHSPPGTYLQMKFVRFDLENHSICKYDSVEVRDGADRFAPQLGRYCGRRPLQGILKSGSNKVWVKFMSDHSTERSGFKLVWKAYALPEESNQVTRDVKTGRECPLGWSYFSNNLEGGACYLVKRNYFNWYGARDDCLSNRGDLVSITTKAEQDFVTRDLLQGNFMWLGYTDKDSEGLWAWSDNTTLSSFNNWDVGDPNNGGRLQNEDCALIKPDGKWNDYPCEDRFNYICKRKPDETWTEDNDGEPGVDPIVPVNRPSNPGHQARASM